MEKLIITVPTEGRGMKLTNTHLIPATIEHLDQAQDLLQRIINLEDSELSTDVDLYDKINEVVAQLDELRERTNQYHI